MKTAKIAFLLAVAVGALVAFQARQAWAQVGILPIERSQPYYQVRLVNDMGYPIRVKMVRFGQGNYLEEDLPRGFSKTYNLYAGERVLCVWNQQQILTLAAQVNVDGSGTLRIRPIAYAYGAAPQGVPRAEAGRPREAMEPLPRLRLDRDN